MTPYERGYTEAIADIAAIAFFFWSFGRTQKGEIFERWPAKLKLLALFVSTAAFYAIILCVVLPIIRFLSAFFADNN